MHLKRCQNQRSSLCVPKSQVQSPCHHRPGWVPIPPGSPGPGSGPSNAGALALEASPSRGPLSRWVGVTVKVPGWPHWVGLPGREAALQEARPARGLRSGAETRGVGRGISRTCARRSKADSRGGVDDRSRCRKKLEGPGVTPRALGTARMVQGICPGPPGPSSFSPFAPREWIRPKNRRCTTCAASCAKGGSSCVGGTSGGSSTAGGRAGRRGLPSPGARPTPVTRRAPRDARITAPTSGRTPGGGGRRKDEW